MPVVTPIQIRFADVDLMGHVNNAHFLTYMELARMDYFREVIGENINWSENGIILARAEIDFISPLHLNEQTECETSLLAVGQKSFTLQYELYKLLAKKRQLCARGKSVLVCYNYRQSQSITIPEQWFTKMKNYEDIQKKTVAPK